MSIGFDKVRMPDIVVLLISYPIEGNCAVSLYKFVEESSRYAKYI